MWHRNNSCMFNSNKPISTKSNRNTGSICDGCNNSGLHIRSLKVQQTVFIFLVSPSGATRNTPHKIVCLNTSINCATLWVSISPHSASTTEMQLQKVHYEQLILVTNKSWCLAMVILWCLWQEDQYKTAQRPKYTNGRDPSQVKVLFPQDLLRQLTVT